MKRKGARARKPICLECKGLIQSTRSHYRWFGTENTLQAKMFLAQRLADAPETKPHLSKHGWVSWIAGRGYLGYNLFCNHRCVKAYLRRLQPQWEPWDE